MAEERQLHEAAAALDDANRGLQQAFTTWSEAVTGLLLAEIALRKAQDQLQHAFANLNTLLPGRPTTNKG